jgi:predicted MPP superfamily phosphohydrolase
MEKCKYLWFTDTHLDKVMPWTKYFFIKNVAKQNPKGIFLTGDISNGRKTIKDLERLAKRLTCPIYFILGNHDYHWHFIDQMHDKIRTLCQKYPNLIWLTEAGVIHINDEVCIIGAEGWYDAEEGKPEYLKMTFDWWLVKDFRKLPSMEDRIAAWRALADKSAEDIANKLEQAIERKYKTIYLLTHFPPWKEATRDVGTFMEKFWLPYNTNLRLGRAIEKVMVEHKKKHVLVLAGHTHTDAWIHVSRNIECKVSKAKYYGEPRNEEHIFI